MILIAICISHSFPITLASISQYVWSLQTSNNKISTGSPIFEILIKVSQFDFPF